jgi:hypothetical protein
MAARKISKPAGGAVPRFRVKRIRRAAKSTLLAAGLAAARWVAEAETEGAESRLFSPGLVDRLRAPVTRFHD